MKMKFAARDGCDGLSVALKEGDVNQVAFMKTEDVPEGALVEPTLVPGE